MPRNFSSIASVKTLSSNVTTTATTISLNNLTGLPTPPYTLVLNPDTSIEEIVTVNSVASGTTLNVSRAQESTTAQAHSTGNSVRHMVTGRDLQEPQDHISASTAVHGLSAGVSVVGNSATQTLTNKTISMGSNTLTGTKAQFNAAMSDDDFATLNGTETIVNKTVNLSNNTLTGTRAQFNTAMSDDDFVTLTGTEVLTNKTVRDSTFYISDETDTTKKVQFQVSGVTTATTRTLTVPDVSGTIVTSGESGHFNPVGIISPFAGSTAPTGWLLCAGQLVSKSTYSSLYTVIGSNAYGTDTSTDFYLPDLRGRTIAGVDNMGGTVSNVMQISTTVNTTSASNSIVVGSAANLAIGMYVVSANIPTGTTITALSGTTVTISQNATATASGTSARFSVVTDANSRGGSGGELTHYLNTTELPNHNHSWQYYDAASNTGDNADGGARWDNSSDTRENLVTITTSSTGGSGAHSNIQPTIMLNYIIKF